MQPSEPERPANRLTKTELIARLQPGAWSELGFLGTNESLDQVITDDAETLARLGVSHDELADTLDELLSTVLEMYAQPVSDDDPSFVDTYFPDLHQPTTIPHFDLNNLPDIHSGFLVNDLQVFIMMYKGWQDCPWGCDSHGRYDFMIVDRKTGESVTGPELMPHLIRTHRFFEGRGTPYRTEPEQLAKVLGLGALPIDIP
ncbi:hypothetical protein [Leptolyngbya ohadii]|uniref:hypothetical protein n=1 Tax=Leptolyngbya ohadii TaxID=1962290 RepID=UPI000B5A0235|nr:hypothetical protein [Leptolyngbya ohadii]